MRGASWAAFVSLLTFARAALLVDLDYATYQGYYDSTYDLNVWKRYSR